MYSGVGGVAFHHIHKNQVGKKRVTSNNGEKAMVNDEIADRPLLIDNYSRLEFFFLKGKIWILRRTKCISPMVENIVYQIEEHLDPEEFVDVLKRSTLAERRPVDNPETIKKMCQYGNLNVTARVDGRMVGVARSLTDYAFCTYLSDLAVDVAYQKRGIGVKLIELTKKQALTAKLILLSAPAAIDYYPKIGMTRHEYCYLLDRVEELKLK